MSPRSAPARSAVGQFATAIGLSVCVAVLVTLLFFLVNWFVLPTSSSTHRPAIVHAFHDGTLGTAGQAHSFDRHVGGECVMLSSFVVDYESRLRATVSPKRVPRYCEGLKAYLDGGQQTGITYYHRYLHGYRTLAAILLLFLPVGLAFKAMLLPAVAVLAVGLYRATTRAGRGIWRGGPGHGKTAALRERLPPLLILSAFALFFGLPEFGARISNGAWAITLMAFVVWAVDTDLFRMSADRFAIAFALFGSLIAHFEFLTGGAPLGLAASIGMVALQGGRVEDSRVFWGRVLTACAAFFTGVVACFLFKHLAVGLVFGWSELQQTGGNLLERAWGSYTDEIDLAKALEYGFDPRGHATFSLFSLIFAIAKLAYASESIAYGSRTLGIGVVGLAVLSLVWSGVYLLRRCGERPMRRQVSALLLSAAVMPVWYVTFLGHTIVHARFMVRPLVWMIALGTVLACWALIEWQRQRRPAGAGPALPA